MGDTTGFQRRLFPHSNTQPVPGIPPVSLQKPNIPVPGLALWPLNSSYGVHLRGQRGQVDGSIAGYKDPPVPRRLVDSSPHHRILPPGHPVPPRPLPGFGLGGESTKIRVGTQTNLRICGLPMRPITRAGQADPKPLGVNSTEGVIPPVQSDFSGQEVHVSDRPSHSNGKTGASGQTSYATHSVAPQGTLEASRVTGKGDPSPRDSSLTPSVADQGNKCLTCQPLHLLCHALQVFTDASSEGWGAHLGDFTANGSWSVPESRLDINFLELKAVLLALKRFQHIVQGQIVLDATDNTTVVAYINKEGGMRSGSICTLLWRLLCWCNLRHIVLKARHIPGHLNVIAGKLSRQGQIIQREWSLHQVFDLLCQTLHRPQVDMFATRYNCKLTQVCVNSPRLKHLGGGRSNSLLGGPRHVCLSPSVTTGQSDLQTVISPVQEGDPDSSRLAQHAVVLGSSGSVFSDTHLSSQPSRSSDSALQQGASQGSDQSQSSRIAPRAEAIKEQGFSSPVAV